MEIVKIKPFTKISARKFFIKTGEKPFGISTNFFIKLIGVLNGNARVCLREISPTKINLGKVEEN